MLKFRFEKNTEILFSRGMEFCDIIFREKVMKREKSGSFERSKGRRIFENLNERVS